MTFLLKISASELVTVNKTYIMVQTIGEACKIANDLIQDLGNIHGEARLCDNEFVNLVYKTRTINTTDHEHWESYEY